jgi:Zn-finger nucleic acid-binding protein
MSLLFEDRVKEKVAPQRCPHCHVHLVARTYEGAPVLHCPYCQGHLLKSGVLERVVARRETTFEKDHVAQVNAWRRAQPETALRDAPAGAVVDCPECGKPMSKAFHLMLTRVVLDRCARDGHVWLDGGELEAVQILVEEAGRGTMGG